MRLAEARVGRSVLEPSPGPAGLQGLEEARPDLGLHTEAPAQYPG